MNFEKNGQPVLKEMQEHFEKYLKTSTFRGRVDRAKTRDVKGVFYEDGNTNDLFLSFYSGFSLGQIVGRIA